MRRWHFLPGGVLLAFLLAAASLLGGCAGQAKKSGSADGTTEISLSEEDYVLLLPSEDSVYDRLIEDGYSEIMEEAGRRYRVLKPAGGSVLEQQKYLRTVAEEKVSCVAAAPNDAEALAEELAALLEAGIDVLSFEKAALPENRELTITPMGSETAARTLLDAVLELTGGRGQWAILSSSSVAVTQNYWIERIRNIMKEEAYRELELLEIAYGNDQYRTSYEQTRALLQNYPDLEVICAPTTVGLAAAAEAVRDQSAEVLVTGFGLPSEMKAYVLEEGICPCFYLWNPTDLGRLTAYVSIALHSSQITGSFGERFRAGGLGEYEVTTADDGGTEVILSEPLRFDADNIEQWAEIF